MQASLTSKILRGGYFSWGGISVFSAEGRGIFGKYPLKKARKIGSSTFSVIKVN